MKINLAEVNYNAVVVGDLNGDGKLTLIDTTRAVLFYNDKIKELDDVYIKALDTNYDGKISLLDITKIILVYAGNSKFNVN